MATERDGLVRRRAASSTLDKLTGPGHTLDERLGAGVRVVAFTGPVAVIADQVAVHGGSVLAAVGSATEPGLLGLAIAAPAVLVISRSVREAERSHDRDAARYPSLESIYHSADKAAALRAKTPVAFRRVAAGSFIASATTAVAAGALALGPLVGLGHTGAAGQELTDVAEVLVGAGAAAALAARHWTQHLAARSPKALGE